MLAPLEQHALEFFALGVLAEIREWRARELETKLSIPATHMVSTLHDMREGTSCEAYMDEKCASF